MSVLLNFDDDARAGMLCYLVVGELVAMAITGDWLKTVHLVELARIRMSANSARCDWRERLAIVRAAADLAPEAQAAFKLATDKMLAPLFTDGWRLDYRQAVVREIHDTSASRMRHVK